MLTVLAGLVMTSLASGELTPIGRLELTLDQELRYSRACGPIAVMVLCRCFDASPSLEESVLACNWKSGEATTLESMCRALEALTGTRFVATSADAGRIAACDVPIPSVLVMRTDSDENSTVQHAVVAIGVRSDGSLCVLDFPTLDGTLEINELRTKWTGVAIVSESQAVNSVQRVLMRYPATIAALSTCAFFGLFRALRRRFP